MKLERETARARLAVHRHGILGTVHPVRGVDLVPVVYVVLEDFVGVPIDRVKPKRTTELRREANLRADPRATLLVEHWDPVDWTRLWWVRSQLRWGGRSPDIEDSLAGLLAEKYPQYVGQPFERVLVLHLVDLTGWSGERG